MTNSNSIMDHLSYNGDEMQSSESNGVEIFSESTVTISEGNHEYSNGNYEVKSHEPKVGMSFSCEEEAYMFYKNYAKEMGFKVRKGKVQSTNGSRRKRYFLCSQQGLRSKKPPTKMTKYTRKETRTDCKAMIRITFDKDKCTIYEFISEHNHDLQGSTQWTDLSSKISKADSLIQSIHENGLVKEAEAGAYARPCDVNYSKQLLNKKVNCLQPQDAQGFGTSSVSTLLIRSVSIGSTYILFCFIIHCLLLCLNLNRISLPLRLYLPFLTLKAWAV